MEPHKFVCIPLFNKYHTSLVELTNGRECTLIACKEDHTNSACSLFKHPIMCNLCYNAGTLCYIMCRPICFSIGISVAMHDKNIINTHKY